MTYAPLEIDPEEDRRIRLALVQADRTLCDHLRAAAPPGTYEAAFLRRDADTFDTTDRALLKRLRWHYRRRLPAWLRPKVNPDDPIVRERELLHG